MSKPLTKAQREVLIKKILKAINAEGFSIQGFAINNHASKDTIRRLIRRSPKLEKAYQKYSTQRKEKARCSSKQNQPPPYRGEEVIKDFKEKTGCVTTRSLNIKTVEELLKTAKINMEMWEVDRSIINSWEVTVGGRNTGTGQCETLTNFQVKVWLKRTSQAVSGLDWLYQKIKLASPIVPLLKRKMHDDAKMSNKNRELEISLMDIHLGMRTFKPESEQDWNVDIAEQMTLEILEDLIRLTSKFGPFERIIFPMGNDFLHTDNCYNTTTAGTFQPEGDAWKRNFLRGELLGFAIVERLMKVAPVKVIVVPGNHAQHSEIALGRILAAKYSNNRNFEIDAFDIDASMSPFKFHNFGVNLIGFEHGHSIRQQLRLAALMANETRLNDVWGRSRYCEWHLGDQHRKGSGKPFQMEELGVSIEFLPGLVPPNEWHKLHAFCWQKRAGMAFVWDKTAGPIARLQVNVDNYSNQIMR